MRNRILVSAAGTASGFHIVQTLDRYFANEVVIFACDTNPEHLVACRNYCEKVFRVPPVVHPEFADSIASIIRFNDIDLYIPLIDQDVDLFPSDSRLLEQLNCRSTGPCEASTTKITRKDRCFDWLRSKGIHVPRQYSTEDVEPQEYYFVKPIRGFGSCGARQMSGRDIKKQLIEDEIIQENCELPEITAELYKHGRTCEAIFRERIETKCGVCTKARVFVDAELSRLVENVVEGEDWPVASCIQFMKNGSCEWVVTDVNLRLGAGSAMCTAVGWDLARAAIANWLELDPTPTRFLQFDGKEKHVVRAFTEIVTD